MAQDDHLRVMMIWAQTFVHHAPVSQRRCSSYRNWRKVHMELNQKQYRFNRSNNCADLAMMGCDLVNRCKYKEAAKFLRRSHNLYQNQYIEWLLLKCELSSKQPDFKVMLIEKRLKSLFRQQWRVMTNYMDECCIPIFTKRLNEDVMILLLLCYQQLFDATHNLKYIRKMEKCELYRFRHQYGCCQDKGGQAHSNSCQTGVIVDGDNEDAMKPETQCWNLFGWLRVRYWGNNFDGVKEILLKVWDLCTRYNLILDSYQVRLFYLSLLYLREYGLVESFRNHQDRLIKSPLEDCDYDSLAMHACFQMLFNVLVFDKYTHEKDMESARGLLVQYRDSRMPQVCVEPGLALYTAKYGDLKTATQYFVNALRAYSSENNRLACVNGTPQLCLGRWLLNFSYAYFLHYMVGNAKMASYFYRMALKQKKNDLMTQYHFGILMHGMRKKEIDNAYLDPYLKNDWKRDQHSKLCIYDECACCGAKGTDFKKCRRCKITFYCSRRCQKNHWIGRHRVACVPKTTLLLQDKVRPHLERTWRSSDPHDEL